MKRRANAIQESSSLSEFKCYLTVNDNNVPNYYYLGKRTEQIIHCRLCLEKSDLNFNLFSYIHYFTKQTPQNKKHIFWKLFIFHRHSTQKPESIAYNDAWGDLFYSAGPHRNQS